MQKTINHDHGINGNQTTNRMLTEMFVTFCGTIVWQSVGHCVIVGQSVIVYHLCFSLQWHNYRLSLLFSNQILNFSTTVGNKDRRKLPLRNSGNIRLDIKFAISRAEELFSVHPEFLQLKPEEETSVEITYAPKEAPSAVERFVYPLWHFYQMIIFHPDEINVL